MVDLQSVIIPMGSAIIGGTFALFGALIATRHESRREHRFRMLDRLAGCRVATFELTHRLAMMGHHPNLEEYQDFLAIEEAYARLRAAVEHLRGEDIDERKLYSIVEKFRENTLRPSRKKILVGKELAGAAGQVRDKLTTEIGRLEDEIRIRHRSTFGR